MKKNIYKKCLKVLMKDGTIRTLSSENRTVNKEDVLGFILSSGKIVSARMIVQTKFPREALTGYPKKMMFPTVYSARKDNNGIENTEKLNFCKVLEENEYLPSVSELLEIFNKDIDKLNLTRKVLGFRILPGKSLWYWSSTIRSSDTLWTVDYSGDMLWCGCYRSYSYGRILPFIKKKS